MEVDDSALVDGMLVTRKGVEPNKRFEGFKSVVGGDAIISVDDADVVDLAVD